MTLYELKVLMGEDTEDDSRDDSLMIMLETGIAIAKSRLSAGCPYLWSTYENVDDLGVVSLALPGAVKMFIAKFAELASRSTGIIAESLTGVGSQTFKDSSLSKDLDEYAISLLGSVCPALNGAAQFVPIRARWDNNGR